MTSSTPPTEAATAADLHVVPIHLGGGSRAIPVEGFGWTSEQLSAYEQRFAADGPDGRLVALFDQDASWTSWEQHPAGDEIVVLLSGRADLIQQRPGGEHRIPMGPGDAVVNPQGVWHTADVHEPGTILTITAALGTEHRPR
jgi:uncharacterized cupin superfamily protein